MIGRLSAQVALLAFAAAVLAGVLAGNSALTVLSRALLAMVVGAFTGQLVASPGKLVLREHLRRRKQEVDRHHLELTQDAARSAEPPSAAS